MSEFLAFSRQKFLDQINKITASAALCFGKMTLTGLARPTRIIFLARLAATAIFFI